MSTALILSNMTHIVYTIYIFFQKLFKFNFKHTIEYMEFLLLSGKLHFFEKKNLHKKNFM